MTISSQTANGAPALVVLGNVLYIAWAETGSNHYLKVMQTSDLKTFSTPLTLEESAHSTSGPALAVFKDVLYIAWTGSNTYLYVAQIVNNAIANVVKLADNANLDQQSHTSPALAADDDYLYIAWTGDTASHVSTGTVILDAVTGADNSDSSPNMYLMRSSDGVNFSGLVNTHETSLSTNGPALIINDGQLVMGWTGSGDKGYLNTMYSTDQGQSFLEKQTDQGNYSDYALALSGNMVAWTGTDSRLNVKQGV